MPVSILVGTQWGDEGKGKVIDVLTKDVDVVVRFQGGNNAGHTVEFDDKKYVLHIIPSGIFRPGVSCIVGNGLVVDPLVLQGEMENLEDKKVALDGLEVSTKCHLILPHHKLMDTFRESLRDDDNKIGTTKRGIGPTYADKSYRSGIRAFEMVDLALFEARYREEAEKYNKMFASFNIETIDIDAEWEKLKTAAIYLTPYIKETVYSVNKAIKSGKNVLCEGAQGAMLDIDHGTYPFVTSSNTTSGGACAGAGIAPKHVSEVIGVMKAYTTRVGEGPFPTELHDEMGEELRRVGGEFGATTGRPRRCGWFDAVISSYSCMINGIDTLAITKLDVLDGIEKIKICTAYELDGQKITEVPSCSESLKRVKPIYEEMDGWMETTCDAKSYAELPAKAQAYLQRISELVDAKIGIISVGPDRSQTFTYL